MQWPEQVQVHHDMPTLQAMLTSNSFPGPIQDAHCQL